ncbi:MAG: 4-phosphopantetheinyl transferase family protein [Alistipes sp.]|nr:4-phosphopantetheinyl transferase family protein [Alistipes sp.]
MLWCAKEALYKYFDEGGLDFIRDIKVLSIDFDSGLLVGQIRDNLPVEMRVMFHSDNLVVYIA